MGIAGLAISVLLFSLLPQEQSPSGATDWRRAPAGR